MYPRKDYNRSYSRNECVKVFDRLLPVYFPSAERSQNKPKCIFPQNKTMVNDLSMLFSWGANLRGYKTQFAKKFNGLFCQPTEWKG